MTDEIDDCQWIADNFMEMLKDLPPSLDWCGACHAWHQSEKHVVKPEIRERILDFKATWFGIERKS